MATNILQHTDLDKKLFQRAVKEDRFYLKTESVGIKLIHDHIVTWMSSASYLLWSSIVGKRMSWEVLDLSFPSITDGL